MSFERASGILLHPSSLPGGYGIGDLGPSAFRFIDWLAGAGCGLWQVLPLGPTGYGDSPYQCFSAFAGNPYLVSPEFLLRDDLLHPDDLSDTPDFQDPRVDFGKLIPWKMNLLERAFTRFEQRRRSDQQAFDHFCAEQVGWLPEYALFMAIKEANGGRSWREWPAPLRRREARAMEKARRTYAHGVRRYRFYQFVFFQQWTQLKAYAIEHGIRVIGDIPIFIAYDSADVWSRPDLFYLDEEGHPTVVAGVPPDYFSRTGQLWGNPLYRWERLKDEAYGWWLERLKATLAMVDYVRLDHFRGFAGYWEIPAGSPTAETGQWVPGPGEDFFSVVKDELGDLPIIAEDLGEITPDVIALRDRFDLPGMKILQFGFSGPDNAFLPHNYPMNCVVYTGTHDTDTTRGWFESAPDGEREFALRYLRSSPGAFVWDLIHAGWSSVASFAVAPLQDFLDLGTGARMNYPGKLGGNWTWRMAPDALSDDLAHHILDLNFLYGRSG